MSHHRLCHCPYLTPFFIIGRQKPSTRGLLISVRPLKRNQEAQTHHIHPLLPRHTSTKTTKRTAHPVLTPDSRPLRAQWTILTSCPTNSLSPLWIRTTGVYLIAIPRLLAVTSRVSVHLPNSLKNSANCTTLTHTLHGKNAKHWQIELACGFFSRMALSHLSLIADMTPCDFISIGNARASPTGFRISAVRPGGRQTETPPT